MNSISKMSSTQEAIPGKARGQITTHLGKQETKILREDFTQSLCDHFTQSLAAPLSVEDRKRVRSKLSFSPAQFL